MLVLSFKDGMLELFDQQAERRLKVSVTMPDFVKSVNGKMDTQLANAEFDLPAAPLKDVSRASKSAENLPKLKHRRLGKKFMKSFNAVAVIERSFKRQRLEKNSPKDSADKCNLGQVLARIRCIANHGKTSVLATRASINILKNLPQPRSQRLKLVEVADFDADSDESIKKIIADYSAAST